MTCREKLKIEQPNAVSKRYWGGCSGCPKDYGYLPNPEYCEYFGNRELCTKCWDREIPGTEEIKEEKEMKFYTKEELGHMVHSELVDVIIELQEKCNKLAFAIKDDHRILSLDIEQKAEEIKKLKGERDALNTNVANLNEEIYGLKLENNLEKSIKSDRESFIEKIKKENTDLVDCIKKRNETIGSLKKENEKLQRDRDFLNLDTGRLNDEIKEKDKEIEKVKNERDWLDGCYHSWVKEATDRSEKIKELEQMIELKNKDLEDKNAHIDHLVERLDDQRKKIEDLENCDVLPYFIRKVVGDNLKADAFCWVTPAEKRSYIKDPICKSVPCSEAIKQLEKKVDDIPCVKLKNAKDELDDVIKYIMNSPALGCWTVTDPAYDKTATHMMRKYKALRNAGFDHDDAMSLIPMWSDE